MKKETTFIVSEGCTPYNVPCSSLGHLVPARHLRTPFLYVRLQRVELRGTGAGGFAKDDRLVVFLVSDPRRDFVAHKRDTLRVRLHFLTHENHPGAPLQRVMAWEFEKVKREE